MKKTFFEFTTLNKELFVVPLEEISFICKTKNGCCIQLSDGDVYNVINGYYGILSSFMDNEINVVSVSTDKQV